MFYKTLCFTLLSFAYTFPALSQTMYIKKNNTRMTAEKSPMSRVIAVLSKGTPVNVLKKEGRHFMVKPGAGDPGWVFKFKLAKKRPSGGGGGGALLAGLTGESSVSARESGSEGSIRGLKKVSKDYARAKSISPEHVEAVERMEKFSVGEKEFEDFKRSGAVGEFAK